MRRGETPYLTIALDKDTSLFVKFRVIINQTNYTMSFDDTRIEKRLNRLRIKLTQEETLSLRDGFVNLEVRAKKENGDAFSSNIVNFKIEECLDDEVI